MINIKKKHTYITLNIFYLVVIVRTKSTFIRQIPLNSKTLNKTLIILICVIKTTNRSLKIKFKKMVAIVNGKITNLI